MAFTLLCLLFTLLVVDWALRRLLWWLSNIHELRSWLIVVPTNLCRADEIVGVAAD